MPHFMFSLLLLLTAFNALYFEYSNSNSVCFRHKAAIDQDIQVTYSVNTPELYHKGSPSGGHRANSVLLQIYDVYDVVVFDTQLSDRGELLFSPRQVGDYKVCLGGGRPKMDKSVGRMSISIENYSPAGDSVDAKRRQEEQTVTRLLAKARAIDQQAEVIQTNFDKFESQVSSTRRSVIITNLLCITTYISVTIWQLKTLRRYLVQRKM